MSDTARRDRPTPDDPDRWPIAAPSPPVAARPADPQPLGERLGDQIGPYWLVGVLGEGGFGVVYMAERRVPLVQRVALKVIKPGMDTRAVIARFEAERQALALMDHPSVAKVFDAGATDRGRPYFVMEYVEGRPITEYCDEQMLTVRQRLDLFIPVCEAVQHAHTKGIIHRDLKPSNILVSIAGGRPIPKVIDFGIAKAISQRLTEHTIFTEQGRLIGTPEYMSPEHAGMNGADIDTRTDVYSLGVLLYELLAGVLPFDPSTLRFAGHAEIQRIIRDVDPPRPSARLTSLRSEPARVVAEEGTEGSRVAGAAGSLSADIARRRRTDPASLARLLRRELEWIPLKAMRKDRAQRYQSALELADDLGNYVEGRPLIAGPESASYRLRKLVRRNRWAFGAAAAVAGALLLGVAGTVWQAVAATRAGNSERTQRILAQASESKAQAVRQFMQDMLASVDPDNAKGPDVTVRQVLDEAARRLDAGSLKDQPEIEGAVRTTLGSTYLALGLYQQAEAQLRPAVAITRRVYGEQHMDVAAAMSTLGRLLRVQGRLDEAEPLFRQSLAICRALLPKDSPELAAATDDLAMLLRDQGRLDEAETLFRQSLALLRQKQGNKSEDVAAALNNLAMLVQSQGKGAEAEPLYAEALAMDRALYPADHPNIARGLNNLALVLQAQGKLKDAEPLCREAIEIRRKALGPDHPELAGSLGTLGWILTDQGRAAEAEPLLRESLAIRVKALPEGHWLIANTKSLLGGALTALGRYDEAEPLLLEGYTGMKDNPQAMPERKRQAIDRIVRLYEAWTKPEQAARYRATLDAGSPSEIDK